MTREEAARVLTGCWHCRNIEAHPPTSQKERKRTMADMTITRRQTAPAISDKRAADIRRAVRDYKEALISGVSPIPGEFERTLEGVKRWSIDRKLHAADPVKQMLKLTEETGELAAAIARDNTEEVIDAVGDIMVVLTILCQQTGISLTGAFESAYQTIKVRTGKTVNGVFIKEEDLQ